VSPPEGGSAISKPSIARSTALMSSLTMASRVTGFLRIWASAWALGATATWSAYGVANNIPNMIFELVAGGIISSLFIPTFMELRETRTEEEAWRFTSHVFNLAFLSLLVLGVVGTIWPGPFVWTQTFRHAGADTAAMIPAAQFFFRFFALQVVLYGAGAIISALLNANRDYFWPAVGPVFNNLVAILAMFAFVWLHGNPKAFSPGLAPAVLAIGTTLAVFVMFAVQIPAVLRTGWRYSWGLGLHDPAVRRMLKLAVPTVVYVVTNLVAVSVRNASATAVTDKGVGILTYAWVFYQLPYGILAVALATAVFTELADAAGRSDMDEFRATFSRGLRATGVLMLPTSAILAALATPLISLYRIGAFQSSDIAPVASALRWWAVGLVFYALTMFVLRAFYSLKDTKTPMAVNLVLTLGVQIALYLVLSTGFGSWGGIGVNGIPIADSVFYFCISMVLAYLLRGRIGGFDARSVVRTFALMAGASVVGAGVAWGFSLLLAPIPGLPGALAQVLVGGSAGLVVAFALGKMLGVGEVAIATDALGRLARRIGGRS
jgi:putative peptidoglycan lipid II flippase